MLNPFPELFYLAPLAPFIIRLIVSIFLFTESFRLLRTLKESNERMRQKFLGAYLLLLVLSSGISLFLGLYAQIGSLIAIFAFLNLLWLSFVAPKYAPHSKARYITYLGLSVALLFLGAGAFAFDIPL